MRLSSKRLAFARACTKGAPQCAVRFATKEFLMINSEAFVFLQPPVPLSEPQLAAARGVEPATLGHVLSEGFTGPEIRCLVGNQHAVAGSVVTCRADGDDNAIVHYAVSQLRSGDFLVVDRTGDTRQACFGGGLAFAAHLAGCAGVLVRGPVTDLAELRELGMPVWATGLTALTSKRRYRQGGYCVPVRMGEFVIQPGMVAIGDENGIVFVAADSFERLVSEAHEMQARQADRRVLLANGALLGEVNGTLEAFEKIRRGAGKVGDPA